MKIYILGAIAALTVIAVIVLGFMFVTMQTEIDTLSTANKILVANQQVLEEVSKRNTDTIALLKEDRIDIDKFVSDFNAHRAKANEDTKRIIKEINAMAKDNPVNNRELSPVLQIIVNRIIGA